MMIAVIGGRIVPSFTRNWLVKRGRGRLPVPPMQRFDKVALLVLLGALALWVAEPMAMLTGVTLAAAGVLHLTRLMRWAGDRSLPEPLLVVLHVAGTPCCPSVHWPWRPKHWRRVCSETPRRSTCGWPGGSD